MVFRLTCVVLWKLHGEQRKYDIAVQARVYARGWLGLTHLLEFDMLQKLYYLRKGD